MRLEGLEPLITTARKNTSLNMSQSRKWYCQIVWLQHLAAYIFLSDICGTTNSYCNNFCRNY